MEFKCLLHIWSKFIDKCWWHVLGLEVLQIPIDCSLYKHAIYMDMKSYIHSQTSVASYELHSSFDASIFFTLKPSLKGLALPTTRRKLVHCNCPLQLMIKTCLNRPFWLSTIGLWLFHIQKLQPKTLNWQPKWCIYAMTKLQLMIYIPTHKIYRNVHVKCVAHNYVVASSNPMAKNSLGLPKGTKGEPIEDQSSRCCLKSGDHTKISL